MAHNITTTLHLPCPVLPWKRRIRIAAHRIIGWTKYQDVTQRMDYHVQEGRTTIAFNQVQPPQKQNRRYRSRCHHTRRQSVLHEGNNICVPGGHAKQRHHRLMQPLKDRHHERRKFTQGPPHLAWIHSRKHQPKHMRGLKSTIKR